MFHCLLSPFSHYRISAFHPDALPRGGKDLTDLAPKSWLSPVDCRLAGMATTSDNNSSHDQNAAAASASAHPRSRPGTYPLECIKLGARSSLRFYTVRTCLSDTIRVEHPRLRLATPRAPSSYFLHTTALALSFSNLHHHHAVAFRLYIIPPFTLFSVRDGCLAPLCVYSFW